MCNIASKPVLLADKYKFLAVESHTLFIDNGDVT